MHRINFPDSTKIDRIIAKDRIFKQVTVPEQKKRLFSDQVDRIRCLYEITAQKLNLKPSDQVPKIFVIQIICKESKLDQEIIKTIDAAFQVPVIFEMVQSNTIKYVASYRRRSEKDRSKWVFSQYFYSKLITDDQENDFPIILSMESLYHHLLEKVIPYQKAINEPLTVFIERAASIEQMQKQADRLLLRVNKEKQYNRRVALNQEYKKLVLEIGQLTMEN